MFFQLFTTQDGTGVSHLGSNEAWAWSTDRYTPSATLCTVYNAWVEMIAASDAVSNTNEPFRYDLVNTGREILAQVTPTIICWCTLYPETDMLVHSESPHPYQLVLFYVFG